MNELGRCALTPELCDLLPSSKRGSRNRTYYRKAITHAPLLLYGLQDHGLQSLPESTKYLYAALACNNGVLPCPYLRLSDAPI
jgi:hypothetical protein